MNFYKISFKNDTALIKTNSPSEVFACCVKKIEEHENYNQASFEELIEALEEMLIELNLECNVIYPIEEFVFK